MTQSDIPTVLTLNNMLGTTPLFEGRLHRFEVEDEEGTRISQVTQSPDSDLWAVYPVIVTVEEEGKASLHPACILLVTVLHGPEYLTWIMNPKGEFVSYFEGAG